MSGAEPYFVQFESDEIRSFTREDWLVVYGIKVSPRCNETKHHECVIEVTEKARDERGRETEYTRTYHWMHGDGRVGKKKWDYCDCTCHYPLSQKAKWMKEHLPSYKNK